MTKDVMLNGELMECFNTFEEADANQAIEKKLFSKEIEESQFCTSLDFNDYASKELGKNRHGIKSVIRGGEWVVS